MAIQFPEDRESFKGALRFTVVASRDGLDVDGETCDLYMPIGMQYADRVEYENIGLGALGLLAAEGGGSMDLAPSDLINDPETQGLVLSEVTRKFSEKAGAVARARTKTAPNPNTRALFKQVSLRSFQFSFKMIPTTPKESQIIRDVIRFFREEMYPEDIAGGESGSLGYKFPNRFRVEMFYDGREVGPGVAPAYLESFVTNYNPTNQTFLQQGTGSPEFSEIDINLTLTESKALSRKDILSGNF